MLQLVNDKKDQMILNLHHYFQRELFLLNHDQDIGAEWHK